MEHNLTEDDFEKISYTNIRNHTGYSLLLGYGSTKQHLKETIKKGHKGVCFTDNGSMMGVLDLYNVSKDKKFLESAGCKDKTFPSIMGVAIYITDISTVKDKDNKYYNLTLLSKTQAGYSNVAYLTSIGYLDEKFYSRPRIDFKNLFDNKKDVICAMGGLNSHVGQAIADNKGKIKNLILSLCKDENQRTSLLAYMERIAKNPYSTEEFIDKLSFEGDDYNSFRFWLIQKGNFEVLYNIFKNKDIQDKLLATIEKFPIDETDWNFINSLELEEDVKINLFRTFCDTSADSIVKKFKEEFKEDFYLEFHTTDLSKKWIKDEKRHEDIGENPQEKINSEIVALAKKYNVKVVLVQDSFIPDKEQHMLQTIMIWNSPGGKDKWYFHEALEIMSLETMYEKVVNLYPWVSDEEFIEWANNTDEILTKCKNLNLKFKPSLPKIDYNDHYVNKVPVVIHRRLMLDLQELNLWSEEIKAEIKDKKSIADFNVPQLIKDKYDTPEKVINFEDMAEREKENKVLEDVLVKMKAFYKKEKAFCKILERSEKDLAMRTALKVMMRNRKIVPRLIDRVKLEQEIARKLPGKKIEDFKQDVIEKFAEKHQIYETSPDPMAWLGGKEERERLVEEINTIQYNGILRLIGYFMLLEDVSNFIKENGYQRGFGRGCLTGDTLVLTEIGFKKLKDLQAGEQIFTHTGDLKKIIKTFKYEVAEELLSIKTENSIGDITLTADHKVYGVKSEIEKGFSLNKYPNKRRKYKKIKHEPDFFPASELKVGDLLFVKTPSYVAKTFKTIDLSTFVTNEKVNVLTDKIEILNPLTNNVASSHSRYIPFDESFSYILGKWIGDGCVSFNEEKRKYVVAFAFNSNDTIEIKKVKSFFENLGFSVGEYKAKDKNLVTLEIFSKFLVQWFVSNFPKYENNSGTKYIGQFKQLNKKMLKQLIKGLMSADGHVGPEQGKNRTESFDTTSYQLVLDVKEVLMYLGIPCSYSERQEHYTGKYLCNKSYKMRFVGISLDVKKNQNKLYQDGYYVKVKSITKATAEPVYDLMIADNPSYLTSNFVVHNSGAGSIVAYALDITDCNPLEYGLLFERFLTKERIGEVYFEVEGFPLKDFIKVSEIKISQEDLKIDDDEMGLDEEIDGQEGEIE